MVRVCLCISHTLASTLVGEAQSGTSVSTSEGIACFLLLWKELQKCSWCRKLCLRLTNSSVSTKSSGEVGVFLPSFCMLAGCWVLESSLLILLISECSGLFLYRITVPVRIKLLFLISSLSNGQRLLGREMKFLAPLVEHFDEFLCCCSHLFDEICFQVERVTSELSLAAVISL